MGQFGIASCVRIRGSHSTLPLRLGACHIERMASHKRLCSIDQLVDLAMAEHEERPITKQVNQFVRADGINDEKARAFAMTSERHLDPSQAVVPAK